ncbi:hypothetical protein STSP2_01154 [Anaerohalosphaera lusitana]|uniref:DUF2062 domain-containing protein n=2 Tax=Anaerohalosphaera lusitana TaxID=1936003 RepID=A0A1U9NK85_9BACT|nr:hypothetical protein STSP2_01154 [Anaerohalosphaera lusitana]
MIALGAAMGIFVAFLPPLGFHTLLAIVLAIMFRANKAVTLMGAWLNNPVTCVPLYLSCYFVGSGITALAGESTVGPERVAVILTRFADVGNMWRSEFWRETGRAFLGIAMELTVGGFVLGGVCGAAAYFGVRKAVLVYRRNHPHRRFRGLD